MSTGTEKMRQSAITPNEQKTSNPDNVTQFLRQLEQMETTDNSEIVPHGQRKCPICGKLMVEETIHFVLYDVCLDHGAWLDNGVLAKILARSKSVERIEKRKAVQAERRQRKGLAGMILADLLFDTLDSAD